MSRIREHYKKKSNCYNGSNLKNVCISYVTNHLGVTDAVTYLHTSDDVVRAIRSKYICRSRLSSVRKKGKYGIYKRMTVGKARKTLAKVAAKESNHVLGFYVSVAGHGLFLDADGQTIVDTAPSKRDKRTIYDCYIVMRP